jgi:hypothetical protein
MKIIVFCGVMPDCCGAFFHDVSAAQYLISKGHTVHMVFVNRKPQQALKGVYQGIPFRHFSMADSELRASEIWTSPHHPIVPFVRRLNEKYEKPLVITAHFGEKLDVFRGYEQNGKWAEGSLMISHHIKNYVESALGMKPPFRRMDVLYPIVFEREVALPDQRPAGNFITLINGNLIKGVDVFLRVANEVKDKQFLGIRPYYRPIQVHNTQNVTWENYNEDVRSILFKTRIMMIPSLSDSWSRVAFEAMYNGIPVLYTKPYESETFKGGTTHGMAEWIEDAAIQCDRTNIQEWVDAIRYLEDPEVYREWSEKGKAKARSLNVFQNAEKYETFLKNFLRDFPPAMVQKKESSGPAFAPAPQNRPAVAGLSARPQTQGAPAFSVFRRPGARR